MRIVSSEPYNGGAYSCVGNLTRIEQKKSQKNLAFKSYEPEKAKEIASRLEKKYGVKCSFGTNGFVAECVERTTKVFNSLCGNLKLPKEVIYKNDYNEAIKASYCNTNDTVYFNKDFDSTFYENIDLHNQKMREEEFLILPDWSSSRHPAHIFAHEYAHCCHWHHLLQRNGFDNASAIWNGLCGVTVPTAIGRLITKYKISGYAVRGNDMCEFLAERMAQDVCNGLTSNVWVPYKDIDVKYDDIFSRKWSYRYSSPQSYIDYFTQQVWNGDIEGANEVGRQADMYLARLEAQPVAETVTVVQEATKETIFERIGNALHNLNAAITARRDNRNDIRIMRY